MKYIICEIKTDRTRINMNDTGVSYYNNFLDKNELEYYQNNKNRTGHIEYMTPLEYYQECAKMFNVSVQKLMKSRRHGVESLEYQTQQIKNGQPLDMPYINYAASGQEGLHRMMALGDKFGWESTRYPVLVVDVFDNQKEDINDKYKIFKDIVYDAIQYRYPKNDLIGSFTAEIEYQLDAAGMPGSELVVEFNERRNIVIVRSTRYPDDIVFEFEMCEFNLKDTSESSDIDDLDIDDFDDLDIDDFDDLDIYDLQFL